MRLKIKIAGSFLREPGKDRPRDKPAVIQLGFARVRIIEHHQTYKLRMIGGQIPSKRNDVLSLFIPASRINLLCGSCFSSNGKTWYGRGSGGSRIAHDSSERITNFSGDFMRMSRTVRYPNARWSCNAAPPKFQRPFSQKMLESGRILRSLRAEAAATILKVEPGSIMSMMARFFI